MKKKPLTLVELYKKYETSGYNGNPRISTRELQYLVTMLKEVEDLIKLIDPIRTTMLSTRHRISTLLDIRGAEVDK